MAYDGSELRTGCAADTQTQTRPKPSVAALLSSHASWAILGVVFAAAIWQGADFASTKPAATAWGAVIGLAAFFAWLAVDVEEYEQEAEEAVASASKKNG